MNWGGIVNSGKLTVLNSTISGNSATENGGIDNFFGTMTLVNSTISGNTAKDDAGLINSGSLSVIDSTIAGNNAAYEDGGIYSNTSIGGLLMLEDTIVAGNTPRAGGDIVGVVVSQGNNVIGNIANAGGFLASDLLNVNPDLGPLQNNGGPTRTMALLPGSPAIGAGAQAALSSLSSAVNASTTQFTVTSALPFAPGMLLTIDDEAMSVLASNLTANTLTVQRGVDGTSAASHTSGSRSVPRHRPARRRLSPRCGKPLRHRRRRGGNQHPDRYDHRTDLQLEPVRRWPAGHLHRDRHRVEPRRGQPDRNRHLQGRLDHARHRAAEHQQRFHHRRVQHFELERRRRPTDHGGVFG